MNKFALLAAAAFSMALTACGGGGGGGGDGDGDPTVPVPPATISPSDSNAVMDSLTVKVGDTEGVQRDGDLPAASTDANAPKVNSAAEVSSANGATAKVGLSFDASSPIAALLMKVTGSDSVFEVDVSSARTKAAMAQQSQAKLAQDAQINFDIVLPSNLQQGSFDVQFTAQDDQGRNSEPTSTQVNVATVGTGALQFSLSWDAAVDLDLYVVEPSGEQIDFTNRESASGGQLDFDDIDGTGPQRRDQDAPNAVENIFWAENPPRGEYVVAVDYFSGDVPTNFTVTITQDGVVVDSVSVNNFSGGPNGSALEVYRLVN